MVRTYKPTTNRRNLDEGKIKLALRDVVSGKYNITRAAFEHGLKRTTLRDRLKKLNKSKLNAMDDSGQSSEDDQQYTSKYTSNQVFTKNQERDICEYFKTCSNLQHGFSYTMARKFVFEYATINYIKIPPTWVDNQTAGIDWVQGFMKRNQDLSLRKPENTSISRLTAFRKDAVMEFFNNVQTLFEKTRFSPCDIYNLDETGITTVLQSPKVISTKGKRAVAQVASAERGSLVTMVGIVNAAGNSLPPVYVFPRVRFKEHFVNGGPSGCLGITDKSGWMTTQGFLNVLEHIKVNTRCSKENQIVLFLDNHISHCSLAAIIFCRENGIHMVTFPPHTSHKLQPLDISVFGPFKKYLATSFNDFLVSNPGRIISIYDIPTLSNIPFRKAFVVENICKGFEKTGISPFNRQIFPESDFVNEPRDEHPTADTDNEPSLQQNEIDHQIIERAVTPPALLKTPEQVRPLPKIQKSNSNNRKGKSRILTSTPSKEEKEEKDRTQKHTKPKKKRICAKKTVPKRNPKYYAATSSSSDLSDISYADSDKSVGSFAVDDSYIEGNFVLVRFSGETDKFYVGKIISKNPTSVKVDFLRKKSNLWTFIEPDIPDICYVLKTDIVLRLPDPTHPPGTSRSVTRYLFDVDMSQYNVK